MQATTLPCSRLQTMEKGETVSDVAGTDGRDSEGFVFLQDGNSLAEDRES